MFFQDPGQSKADVRFRVLGFPVRIHPYFWLMCLLLGGLRRDPGFLFIWAAVVLVSILVHELGHALTMRKFGEDAEVVLYGMGGLAMSTRQRWRRTYSSQILISLGGPAAGFVLGAAAALVAMALRAEFDIGLSDFGLPHVAVDWPRGALSSNRWAQAYIEYAFNSALWVNIYWGMMNLMPVYPLDGGQALRAWLEKASGERGLLQSLWISVAVGGGIAAMALLGRGGLWLVVLYGWCAWSSYQAIQALGRPRWARDH